MENLSYTYKSGNLAQGMVFDELKWNLKNRTQISATNLEVKWDPTCWRGKQLCVKSAEIGEVTIVVAKTNKKTNPIRLKSIDVPFSILAESLNIDKLVIENSAPKPIVIRDIKLNGSLHGSTVKAESLEFNWNHLHTTAQGTLQLNKDYPVAINGHLQSQSNALPFPVQSGFNLSGDLLNMAIDAALTAPYAADITGSISTLTRRFPANLDIRWGTTRWPRTASHPKLYADDGILKLTGFWPDYDVTGSAKLHSERLPPAMAELTGTINTKRATFNPLQLSTLDGVIDATGVLKWRNGVSWQANVIADSIKPSAQWPELDGYLHGTAVVNGRTNNGLTQLNVSDINSYGIFKNRPFNIKGSVSKSAEGALLLSGLEAQSEKNTISANGIIDQDSDLSLYFSLNSPEDLSHELSGDLHGSLAITGNIKQPDIRGSMTSSSLAFRDYAIKNTKVEGVIRSLAKQRSNVTVIAQKVVAKERELLNVKADFSGALADHQLTAKLSSPPLTLKQLRINGALDEYNNWTGIVSAVKGNVGSYSTVLNNAFAANWNNNSKTIALEPHCWSLHLAYACLRDSTLIGKTGAINFSLDGIDLQSIAELHPHDFVARGKLRSTGLLKWGPNSYPSVQLDTQVDNASLTLFDANTKAEHKLDFSNVEINTTTRNKIINTKINLDTLGQGHLDANVAINAGLASHPLSGSIKLSNAKLQWLKRYAPQLQILEGDVSIDTALSGNLFVPEFKGDINITNASIASPVLPMDLSEVAIDLSLNGTQATINGRGKAGGRDVALQGSGSLTDQSWESELNIKAERIPLRHELLENAVVSPDLKIVLNPEGISVGGQVTVPRAHIQLDSLGAKGIPLSRDIIVVDAVSTVEKRKKIHHNVSSRVDIVLGRDVRFEGYGLNADLRGDFTVKLSPQRTPELLGAMMIDTGTYRSYGQNLRIKSGLINFVGPLEQALISVEAVRDVGDILVGLRVEGLLQNPRTTLFSSPSLPDEEILSYIVLGRKLQLGEARSDDSRLLANAALFMGISNGRALSANVAESLGIDDFALSARGTGEDTQVLLSGRLNDRLLIRYGVSLFNSVNTLFLRYDLAEKLYLETTQGLEKAVDLFYSFEFD